MFRNIKSGVERFTQPQRRLGHAHVNIVGPLPHSNGYRYLFTITERSTRWSETILMRCSVRFFLGIAVWNSWCCDFRQRKWFPLRILEVTWRSFGHLVPKSLYHTTAYNPSANGLIGRVHRTLKLALIARCDNSDYNLPWVLCGLQTIQKEDSNVSPAEMVYGRQ